MQIKIIHIITGLNEGGAEATLFNLINNTKEQNNFIISLKGKGKYGALLRKKGIKVYSINFKFDFSLIKKFFYIIKIIKKINPDIVQTWMYHADLIGGIASYIANKKNIFWGIHHTSLKFNSNKKSIILIATINRILSYVIPKKIIVCANKAKETHIKFGFDKSKFHIIHNGIDFRKFKKSKIKGLKYRKKISASENEIIFGTVARFDPNKDHLNLLKALKEIKKKHIKFKYLLVGKNMNKKNNYILRNIYKHNLEENIILLGEEKDIVSIMNTLDLHILPSKSEAFPLVLLESIACGTLSISTNVGDVEKIIKTNSLLVKPKNHISLYEGIMKFLAISCDEKSKIINQSILHIKKNYSVEKMANSYINIYKIFL